MKPHRVRKPFQVEASKVITNFVFNTYTYSVAGQTNPICDFTQNLCASTKGSVPPK